jgi:hypothetical protein
MADVKKEICGFKPSWSFVPLVGDELGILARTLIHIDKDAIGAVHDGSLRRWTCAEIAMPGEQKWKREKGRP